MDVYQTGADEIRPVGRASELIARGLLSDGLRNGREEINLRAACLPREALGNVFAQLMNDAPELFYVENRLSYTYDAGGTVLTVTPSYRIEGDALSDARQFYQTTVEQVMAYLHEAQARRCTSAWSDADTVLFLHDYLAGTYDYDTEGNNFDAYSLFRNGVGVCQAYALAFLALGRAAGLETDMVTSREMNHAWNHVRVDGVWYHVDVTRDDPIREPGTASIVRHTRLLRSDEGMLAAGYTGFSCGEHHVCASARFETEEGAAWLHDLSDALLCLPTGWFRAGEDAETGLYIPVSLPTGAEGVPDVFGTAGDMDGDGIVTPADLIWLAICFPESCEGAAWEALRVRVLDAAWNRAPDRPVG